MRWPCRHHRYKRRYQPLPLICGSGWPVRPFGAVFIWVCRSVPIWRKKAKGLFCFTGRILLQSVWLRPTPRGMDGRHRGKVIRFLSRSTPRQHAAGGACTNGMACHKALPLMRRSRFMYWRLLPHGLSERPHVPKRHDRAGSPSVSLAPARAGQGQAFRVLRVRGPSAGP